MAPPLTLTFLGTGTSSGVPMIGCGCEVCTSPDPRDKRLRSSVLIQSGSTTLAVDTGPDFRYQMLRGGVTDLDAVLYTHSHKDHTAGMDDVRAYNFFSGRPMPLYGSAHTLEVLQRDFAYAFAPDKYPGVPDLQLHTIDTAPFAVGDIPVQPIPVWHLRMPVLGFRFGPITYITDANRIEAQSKDLIRGSQILVLNALRWEPHISHFSLPEAVALAQELEVPEVYFTHISHQLGRHAEVDGGMQGGIRLAWDGLQVKA